ncbi:uncharacterized protein LOC122843538 [Gambusia affinis]|uniref:Apolipoprotein M n=1 Tax=Gambusia affinis TaxID=33528 RepID=A0A315WC43_GAMAF|nr:uncharacterized protein LOC122843538 [Gambusia affinis]PWA33354.1 hypothetical protein CCH79_00014100 [Gambusia affinis]
MNLWLGSLLFASLLLIGSALSPEECQPLVEPISLADPSVMYGKVNFLAGYTDHDFHSAMLKLTQSSWVNITASPAGNNEILTIQANNINGTCLTNSQRMKIEGNTVTSSYLNMTSAFHVLPSCDSCLVLLINSTAENIEPLLQLFKLSNANIQNTITARSLYFLDRGSAMSESDMERFKKQASCLGFSGEPDFLHKPEKSFCKEEESIRLPDSL